MHRAGASASRAARPEHAAGAIRCDDVVVVLAPRTLQARSGLVSEASAGSGRVSISAVESSPGAMHHGHTL